MHCYYPLDKLANWLMQSHPFKKEYYLDMLRFPLQDGKVGLVWVFPYLDDRLQWSWICNWQVDKATWMWWTWSMQILALNYWDPACSSKMWKKDLQCNDVLVIIGLVEWIIPPTTFLLESYGSYHFLSILYILWFCCTSHVIGGMTIPDYKRTWTPHVLNSTLANEPKFVCNQLACLAWGPLPRFLSSVSQIWS